MFSSNTTQVGDSGPFYIEDVFSTYLYTGNDAAGRLIQNNIDLSTKGGMVWLKSRDAAFNHGLWDTARGGTYRLLSNLTNAQDVYSGVSAFNTNGFTIGSTSDYNNGGSTFASWTFRKQPKFFDVVTYTGTGAAQNINHNLGSTPGCIIVKRTDSVSDWTVYHRRLNGGSNVQQYYALLNSSAAQVNSTTAWNNSLPQPTYFSVGANTLTNTSGASYVAYILAHDSGGFGVTNTDNVISCGIYTGNGGTPGPEITLGYEPQYLLIKRATGGTGEWKIIDAMRGLTVSPTTSASLNADTADAEGAIAVSPSSTGFSVRTGASTINASGSTYIYIAIRRGPMKLPTSGTSVFSPVTYTGDGTSPKAINAGFPADSAWGRGRTDTFNWNQVDRLRGSPRLSSNATSNEATSVYGNPTWDTMTGLNGVNGGTDNSNYNQSSMGYIFDVFRRAPSFMDVVCYTGNGTAGATQTHNLGAIPQMMVVKDRNYSGGRPWVVYHSALGATQFTYMNQTTTPTTSSAAWNDTAPTSSVFTLGSNSIVNFSGTSYVAYLFATCAGVSKVGSYTGTGALQTINCGFTGGARFVYIHRTDDVGDWYVWDSARGITSGNDPYLLTNSTAVEVTGTNYVDTDSTGFKVTAAAPAALNASGGTYIFLAIA